MHKGKGPVPVLLGSSMFHEDNGSRSFPWRSEPVCLANRLQKTEEQRGRWCQGRIINPSSGLRADPGTLIVVGLPRLLLSTSHQEVTRYVPNVPPRL